VPKAFPLFVVKRIDSFVMETVLSGSNRFLEFPLSSPRAALAAMELSPTFLVMTAWPFFYEEVQSSLFAVRSPLTPS